MKASISIWKDKLVLRVSEIGGQNLKQNIEIVEMTDGIRGFIRYNKKFNAFLMTFSAQNLRRIKRVFGENAQFIGKRDHLNHLKSVNENLSKIKKFATDVKQGLYDSFKIDYKMDPLATYQHRGVVLLSYSPAVPLFADCGMGKSYMVLCSTENQIGRNVLTRGKTLICGKLATLEASWMEDVEKFTDLKATVLWESKSYKRKEKIIEKMQEDSDIFLINHDGLRVYEEELSKMNFEKVVVDESTVLKSFKTTNPNRKGGKFGKALMNVSAKSKWRVIMSGTPAPNGVEDLWGQFHFLDPNGLLLERSFNDFNQEFMDFIVFGKLKLDKNGIPMPGVPADRNSAVKPRPKPDTIDRVGRIIEPFIFRVRLRDEIKNLPERTTSKRIVEMSKEQLKTYKELEEELATIIDDEYVSVSNRLDELGKLRQVTGGFLRDHDGVDHPIKDSPKLNELDSMIYDEIGQDNKIVIFAEYRWEIQSIVSRYKDLGIVSVYGGNKSDENIKNINSFVKDEATKIIVVNPKSGAHGLTLTMAHYLIFYSFSHSSEENYQAIKRIERAVQKNKMFVYYLICKNSVDEKIFKALKVKERNQGKLIDQNKVSTELLKDWRCYGRKKKA